MRKSEKPVSMIYTALMSQVKRHYSDSTHSYDIMNSLAEVISFEVVNERTDTVVFESFDRARFEFSREKTKECWGDIVEWEIWYERESTRFRGVVNLEKTQEYVSAVITAREL